MNKLTKAINYETNKKFTENGANAFNELNNPVLTMFAQAGALRPRSKQEIEEMFEMAYRYNSPLTVKMLFYIGDIRGGLGERRTFRICLRKLANIAPDIVVRNLKNIAYFNRWDSIYELVGTSIEDEMWNFMRNQWKNDLKAKANNKPCSLLGKWLKSANTSSYESRELARATYKALGYRKEKDYRKALSAMRAYISIVEKKMSARDWLDIDYEVVPSYAMKKYRKAFERHTPDKFKNFMQAVERGDKEIKASTLFPYDLVKVYTDRLSSYWFNNNYRLTLDPVIEAQWKALPNYLENDNSNVIVMADVSGSMHGRPIASSLGLAIYFAQHNKGDFHNQFMTFTNNPHFISIKEGESLASIVKDVFFKDVGFHTNLEAAFDYLLKIALSNNCSQEDLPKAIIVVSDNEIDRYKSYGATDFLGAMGRKYAQAGYKLPKLIFFQVEARQSTFLTLSNNALFISGQSAAAFKSVIDNIEGTVWTLVLNTLNSERYQCVLV